MKNKYRECGVDKKAAPGFGGRGVSGDIGPKHRQMGVDKKSATHGGGRSSSGKMKKGRGY